MLGWDTSDIEEVTPEFPVETLKVDYALRIDRTNLVFIEVKRVGHELDNVQVQEQLLKYSFSQGVDLVCLTNGLTWWFYLPMAKGQWQHRKFYSIDLNGQDTREICEKFGQILSKEYIRTGQAIKSAQGMLQGTIRRREVEATLPEAWNSLISGKDDLLKELIAETTEKICGFKPSDDEVSRFLSTHEETLLVAARPPEPAKHSPGRKKRTVTRTEHERPKDTISQPDLVSLIVETLKRHNGRATKATVENEIWSRHRAVFAQPWYQEKVSHGVPRWQHNIAWAKERAKHEGLIKPPSDSGRGMWELTEKGRTSSF